MTPSDDLIVKHIPLVRSIANHLDAPNFKDDLVGEGVIALIKCAEKFDPERGITFGAYAKHRVRGAMLHWIRRNVDRNTEPIDDYLRTLGNDGQPARFMLKDDLGYYLHPVEEWVVVKRYFEKMRIDDIASELGFKVSRVSQIHSNALRKLKKAFAPTEDAPQEESADRDQLAALLQVVRKMMWDEWGVEVEL